MIEIKNAPIKRIGIQKNQRLKNWASFQYLTAFDTLLRQPKWLNKYTVFFCHAFFCKRQCWQHYFLVLWPKKRKELSISHWLLLKSDSLTILCLHQHICQFIHIIWFISFIYNNLFIASQQWMSTQTPTTMTTLLCDGGYIKCI